MARTTSHIPSFGSARSGTASFCATAAKECRTWNRKMPPSIGTTYERSSPLTTHILEVNMELTSVHGGEYTEKDLHQAYCLTCRWRGLERWKFEDAEDDRRSHLEDEGHGDTGVLTYDRWYGKTRGVNKAKVELQELQKELGCSDCRYCAPIQVFKPRCTLKNPSVDLGTGECGSWGPRD